MTLSSMVISRDLQEVSVLECILGGLHIGVEVEAEPERARAKLAKSKIDALIIDCDLDGSDSVLRGLQEGNFQNSVPLVIVSGSRGHKRMDAARAAFVFQKPISVEQAVHTLSAARNMILDGRLRYHREALDVPVCLAPAPKKKLKAHLTNLSQGGMGIRMQSKVPVAGDLGLSFMLPGTKRSIRVKGEIAWADQRGNAGIRFLEIQPELKRDLQLWLEQQYLMH